MRKPFVVRPFVWAAIGAVLVAGLSGAALAQGAFPSRTVEIVVPQPPGGANDVPARILAEKLQKRYGQTVAVVNRPGAGGNVGAQYVVNSKPDGHTLLFLGSSLVFNAALGGAPFKFPDDMTTIAKIAGFPSVVAINAQIPAKTVDEFVKWTRQAGNKVNYGSAGVGSGGHIFGAAFKHQTGATMAHIPFTGGPAAVNALLAGDISVFIAPMQLVKPFIDAGQLRGLAVTSEKRLPGLESIPTMAEAGYPKYVATQIFGIWSSRGVPPDIVAKLNKDISEIVQEGDVKEKLAQIGMYSQTESAAAFRKELEDSIAYWTKTIAESGAKNE